VSLKIRDTNLHAKFYYFEYHDPSRFVAFVGSSNFTIGGFQRNEEVMVRIAQPADRPAVAKALNRLCGLGSFPYNAWKASELLKKR